MCIKSRLAFDVKSQSVLQNPATGHKLLAEHQMHPPWNEDKSVQKGNHMYKTGS